MQIVLPQVCFLKKGRFSPLRNREFPYGFFKAYSIFTKSKIVGAKAKKQD